jgi:Glyoxalase-like domain
MGHNLQIVIDCVDPHVLADWWAETLQWHVEPQDEAFIRSMIDQGFATESDTRMYRHKIVWREAAAIHPDTEASPERLRVLFQLVPDAKSGKNRVHIDIRIDGDDVAATRERLVERGATVLHHGRQGPHTWVTMADPEGNEFCI